MQALETTGLTEIVESWEVSAKTSLGYKVVGMFQETESMTQSCSMPHPNPSYNGEQAFRDELAHNTTTKFIVTLDEESSLGMLNGTIERQKKEISELGVAKHQAEQDIEGLKKGLEQSQKNREDYRDKWATKTEECTGLTQVKQKMETDLGRIREAIGTQRMDEILNVK